jgi:hypothetical protein
MFLYNKERQNYPNIALSAVALPERTRNELTDLTKVFGNAVAF